MSLNSLTIAEARDKLRAGEVSSREITEDCLKAIDAADRLNAVVHKLPERALEMADAADARLKAEGKSAPSLCGVPLGIKDLFCTEGAPSQAASLILEGFKPPYESTVTRQLWEAGAVMLGKLNMDEFAMGSSNENSAYRADGQPVARERRQRRPDVPGGSSAAARRRQWRPASVPGCHSAPTPAARSASPPRCHGHGRPQAHLRAGARATASSPSRRRSTRSARSPVTVRRRRDSSCQVIGGRRPDADSTTVTAFEVPAFHEAARGGARRLHRRGDRTCLAGRSASTACPISSRRSASQVRRERLERTTARAMRPRSTLPHEQIRACRPTTSSPPAEASSNLARFDGVRYGYRSPSSAPSDGVASMYAEAPAAEGFGAEVQAAHPAGRRIVLSAGYYDAYYLRAQKVRALIKRDFEQVFDAGVDAILTPSTPSAAFGIGDPAMEDPVKMYLNDVFTVTVNLAGLPGISVPAGLDQNGLPLGLQLIGKPWGEAELLDAAFALERSAGFSAKPERWW